MEEILSGIVLGSVNYGENDKILSIFTIEQGVVSAKIRGVKKAGAKLKFCAEPFCFAEFLFAKKGTMRTVTGASLIESFYPIRQDLVKYYCGAIVLEYVKKFIKEGIISQETFVLVIDCLKEITYGNDAPKVALVNFFLKALTLSGYPLNLYSCANCLGDIDGRVFFDYVFGAFYCENCKSEGCMEINALTYDALKAVAEGKNISEEQAEKPLRLIDFYLRNKADVSLKTLKDLLAMNADV